MSSIPRRLTLAALSLLVIAPASLAQTAATLARGKLVLDTVHGFSLDDNLTGESPDRTVAVYLPPSYADVPERRFPVVYLLHGIGGTHADWTQANAGRTWGTLQDVLDRGIAAGRLAELIVVAPDQLTRMGGSFYTNSEATGNWEDFTVVDLVGHVDETYRTLDGAASRGIAGHSMGGYGALVLGMKHPDVFQLVYGMNAALLGFAGDLTAENDAYGRAFAALGSAPAAVNRRDFYQASFLCVAQAFSPDPGRPPFYLKLPFEPHAGELRRVDAVYAQWEAKMPLVQLASYTANLRRLRGLRFDSGRYDQFSHIVLTNRALSERLTELSIPHVFEEYNGDHRNRLWGEQGRLATEVFPWFSRLLAFE